MVLAVASAGWVFDVYEGQLFTIFKTPMLGELAGGGPSTIEWQANVGFAAFLLGGAAGGLLFGILGDRYGSVRIMAATILVGQGLGARNIDLVKRTIGTTLMFFAVIALVVGVGGFSSRTCLPASSASRAIACRTAGGVQIATVSTSGRAS